MIDIKLYTELLDIIDGQGKLIVQQNEIITRLVNENAEKENMLNVLTSDEFSSI